MKRMIALILTGMVLTGAAWAHCGSCEGDKAKGEAKAKCGTKDKATCPQGAGLEKLNLSDEQKAKIADLQKDCAAKATSKEECRKLCAEGLKNILTEEQYKQWEAACKPAKKKGCGSKCSTKK